MVRVARHLRRQGYPRIRILDGGLEAWVTANMPVEANDSAEAAVSRAR